LSFAEDLQTVVEENHTSHTKPRFLAQSQGLGWQGQGLELQGQGHGLQGQGQKFWS